MYILSGQLQITAHKPHVQGLRQDLHLIKDTSSLKEHCILLHISCGSIFHGFVLHVCHDGPTWERMFFEINAGELRISLIRGRT